MKKIAVLSIISFFFVCAKAQKYVPFSVEISQNGTNARFVLKQDISTENVIISLNIKGDIEISVMDQGEVEYFWLQSAISGKIEKIDNVKFEYYFDANNSGKIKKIGNLLFTYYDFHAHESKVGKVKSIGNYTFDYYDFTEEQSVIGNLSKINEIPIGYYFGLENKGKLQRIGNIRLNYNTDFDGNVNAGKITGIVGSQEGVLIKTALFVQGQ